MLKAEFAMRQIATTVDRRRAVTGVSAISLVVVVVLFFSSLVLVTPTVDAQPPELEIDASIAANAAAVVTGEVTSSTTIQVGQTPYTIQTVQVENTLMGQTPDTIRVAIPGGVRADGTIVHVSHTPEPVSYTHLTLPTICSV